MTTTMLVTGKHGQLAMSMAERAKVEPHVELVFAARPEFDLADPETFAPIIRDVAPDIIVNAAAYTAVDQAEQEEQAAMAANAVAPGALAELAAARGARFIHVSTDYVYSGDKEGLYVETDPVEPQGAYGRSKLQGEINARQANPETVILRTAWVYSPFGKNFLKTMLAVAENRDELNVVDDQLGCPTNALDLADAILAIAGKWAGGDNAGLGETYHCAGSGETSWCGFARHIFAESQKHGGPTAKVNAIATADWPTPAKRPANSRLDGSKFARDFEFAMPDWRQSSAEVVARLLA